jgi:hypothetical protein
VLSEVWESLKKSFSEIIVKQIHVNQGVGVFSRKNPMSHYFALTYISVLHRGPDIVS